MQRNYVVGESVYLPARYSAIRNAVLTVDVIGVNLRDRKVTVRLANGDAEVLSFEELEQAYDRVQRLRQE